MGDVEVADDHPVKVAHAFEPERPVVPQSQYGRPTCQLHAPRTCNVLHSQRANDEKD